MFRLKEGSWGLGGELGICGSDAGHCCDLCPVSLVLELLFLVLVVDVVLNVASPE